MCNTRQMLTALRGEPDNTGTYVHRNHPLHKQHLHVYHPVIYRWLIVAQIVWYHYAPHFLSFLFVSHKVDHKLSPSMGFLHFLSFLFASHKVDHKLSLVWGFLFFYRFYLCHMVDHKLSLVWGSPQLTLYIISRTNVKEFNELFWIRGL